MFRLDPHTFISAPDGPLESAARASQALADVWRDRLTESDRRFLLQGFHLAETLAAFAIVHARRQVPSQYHEGLDAQAADEARHIGCFDEWLELVPEVPEPAERRRQTIQWLVLLLVNELTGFCQFCWLSSLLEHPLQRAEVDRIVADERGHILRLLNWLAPLWNARSAPPLAGYLARFRKNLPGRMCQFFPRQALDPLRMELVEVVDGLIAHLPWAERGATLQPEKGAAARPSLRPEGHVDYGSRTTA